MTQRSAVWAVVAAATLWGTTGSVTFAIGGLVDPVTIGAVTMGCGGLALFALAAKASWRVVVSAPLRLWWILGSLGVVAYPLAFYTGMDLAGVAVGNVLTLGTGPLVGAVLEWSIDRRPPRPSWWIATGIGVAGVVVLSLGDHSATQASPDRWGVGVGLAFVAGIGYGVFSYAMGRISSQGHSALASAGAVFGPASIPLIAVALWGSGQLVANPQALWGLGYLVALPMVLSYVLYSRALVCLASSTVLTIALVEPAVATLMAISVVGERFDAVGAIGIALIGCAAVLASRARTVRVEGDST